MSCARCADAWSVYFDTEPLAWDLVRHSQLLECPGCGQLFDCIPEGRKAPVPLTADEAREGYPGDWVGRR